eukprot:811835-Pyramimonas_sp.AAC.1
MRAKRLQRTPRGPPRAEPRGQEHLDLQPPGALGSPGARGSTSETLGPTQTGRPGGGGSSPEEIPTTRTSVSAGGTLTPSDRDKALTLTPKIPPGRRGLPARTGSLRGRASRLPPPAHW